MFTIDFYQTLLLAIVGIALGGIALWTWQRKYWEYQLHRQTEDWKLRQCYSRRDSQRVAMEELLEEINASLEDFIASTWLLASAIKRSHDKKEAGGSEQALEKWDQEIKKSVEQFNETEYKWFVQSRVISGQISLHFHDPSGEFLKRWDEIIHLCGGTCEMFHKTDINTILHKMLEIRHKKNELLDRLQTDIDRFVSTELEYQLVV